MSVLPGTYKIELTYGDQKYATSIEVKSDPRIEVKRSDLEEVYTYAKDLQSSIQKAADAVKQLIESKNIADKIAADLKKIDETANKDLIESSEKISKKIENLVAEFIGKVDKRQGITRNPEVTVMQRLNLANSYVQSRKTGINDNELRLINFAKSALNITLGEVNGFFKEDWRTYRDQFDVATLSPFKEVNIF